jgi:hypothetical protein
MAMEATLMSVVIRMRFDGKVFIPEDPVDVPLNEPLDFEYKPPEPKWDPEKAKEAVKWLTSRAISGLNIPDEALRRENLYEDRGL